VCLDVREDGIFGSAKLEIPVRDRQRRRKHELNGREENNERPLSRRSRYYVYHSIFRSSKA